MGQNHSLPLPRYGWCISAQHSDLENYAHSRDHRKDLKKHCHRRNLSAAFSFSPESVAGEARDVEKNSLASPTSWSIAGDGDEFRSSIWSSDTGTELVNINTATEEELMTLRGVNRSTARAIVEHRVAISGYRRIEDLALVSGVGAARLQVICDEICVSPRGRGDYRCSKLSRRSSTTSSGIDISGTTTSMDSRVTDGVPAAAQISSSRSTVETPHSTAGTDKYYVGQAYATHEVKNCYNVDSRLSNLGAVNASSTSEETRVPVLNFRNDNFVKSCHVAEGLNSLSPQTPDNSGCNACVAIYGSSNRGSCVSRTSPSVTTRVRSQVDGSYSFPLIRKGDENVRLSCGESKEDFVVQNGSSNPTSSSRSLLRLGVWSLDGCSKSKVDNQGVREVVALTILENQLSIVALHDLIDDEYVLQKFCTELNNAAVAATLVRQTMSERRSNNQWRYYTSANQDPSKPSCGFLYDSELISNISESGRVSLITNQILSKLSVCAATLTVRAATEMITFCSVSLSKDNRLAYGDDLQLLLRTIQEDVTGNIVLAGTHLTNLGKEWLPLTNATTVEYTSTKQRLPLTNTSISDEHVFALSVPSVCSNMWLNKAASALHSGHMKIIFDDLTSPRIPKGSWGWGGSVSSFCPVYAELSVSPHQRTT